jgi:hypothetical protein
LVVYRAEARQVLQFFRLKAKALQNCGFSGSCSETEVSEQLYYENKHFGRIKI